MIAREGLPEENELVICKVKTIQPHCAFLELIEYKNKEGMMHISEVASGWVKNIRNHMQENQQIVCKVLSVDKSKGYIDLSLKRLSAGERDAKLNEWKIEKKMLIMLERVAEHLKKTSELESVANNIIEHFGSLAAFYAELNSVADKAFEGLKLPKGWGEEILNLVQEHIMSQRVRVSKTINLTCLRGDGILRIKDIFTSFKPQDGIEVSFTYLGAPRYIVTIIANDYKRAGDAMESMIEGFKVLAKQNEVEFSEGK